MVNTVGYVWCRIISFARRAGLVAAGLAVLATACGQAPVEVGETAAAPAAAPLTVYTVNYPLSYFATRIGGDRVRVEFPAPPDGDPAAWAPGAEDIVAYQQADLILLNGAGYAGWTRIVTLPEDKLVNTSASFADRYISEDSGSHSHGPDGEHSHEAETAFTTWLDPQLAIAHAAAIRDALSARQPEAAADFQAGFEALQSDLTSLDTDFEAVFGQLGDAPVVFSHPVYQYLERRFGINGVSVHWEPGEMPGNEELMKLANRLVSHPAQMMIWEGEPMPDTVAALSAMSVDSVVLDPCGNRPADGDFLTVMQENVANLRAAVSE
jgi:zinc transport system substrate-binding protein